MPEDFWTIHKKIEESKRPKINIDQISNLIFREKLHSASLCTYMIIIFQRKYLGKSMLIMMMSTLLALLAWTFKIPLHHMWVVPTSSELAGSKKSHPFFKPFTCLLLRKKRKDWEKKPRNQVFFCHQTCTDNLGSFNSTQSFPRESKFKVKISTKVIKFNFSRFERFLHIDLRIQDVSYFYIVSQFFVIWFFLYGELVSSNVC